MAEFDTLNNFSFPSTGDPERDVELAASFRRSQARQIEGICPNGCGPLDQDDDAYRTRTCPACGFTGQTMRLGG